MLTYLLGIIILGLCVGLVSGMFGIGGGGIIIPALLPLLPLISVPKTELMFMAMGTSFATMIVSTSVTAYNHYLKQNINFIAIKYFLPIMLITVLLTSRVVTAINQNFLKLFFSLFLVYFGISMLRKSKQPHSENDQLTQSTTGKNALVAVGIGLIATLGGVSGAGMIVPFLNKIGLPMKKAIGTASFCGVFLTLFATVGFIVSGLSQPNLPSYSLGYIHLPTVSILSLFSIPMSKVGVNIMSKLSERKLKQSFAIFLIVLSLYMAAIALKTFI
ncbi:sulfite exporter TauE/SafE family protein [Vagococcus silagei]|uniref:Probable membrane transporter protein n=1 Tax=Vagococcus silagei TaxID=2508885 RepID=A0A4S3B5K1_9ENTE|nr:sulfite exporter TauE/SafE family protein [Vagococcus silagei]THB60933.1 sulfite exporter TauE/SafE family protein [Vagococcus silagei]